MTKTISSVLLVLPIVAVVGCSDSMTSPTVLETSTASDAVVQAVPVTADEPSVPVPVPAPVPEPDSLLYPPCTTMSFPAIGSTKMRLCVTTDGGTKPGKGVEVTYAGVFIGKTDEHGQLMISMRGYGGTTDLTVFHPFYRGGSPFTIRIQLREELISHVVDLGPSSR